MQQQFPPNNSEKRYDADEMKKVIGMATRLQHQHQNTLSSTQIEQLGRELGIADIHVRQALQLITQSSGVTTPELKPRRKHLTKAEILTTVRPALIFCVAASIIFAAMGQYQWMRFHPRLYSFGMPLTIGVVPFCLAVISGWKATYWKSAVLGGFSVGLGLWIAAMVSLMFLKAPMVFIDWIIFPFLGFTIAGVIIALLSHLIKHQWNKRG
jgi:hypothetical protein